MQLFSGHYDYEVVHVKVTVYRPVVLEGESVYVAVFDFDGEVGVFLFFAFVAFVVDAAVSLDGVFGFVITGIDAFVLFKRAISVGAFYLSFYDQIVA